MSIFAKESIQTIAETAGINLRDDVAAALIQDVEYRLRDVISEASKFMHRSCRQKLIPEDINSALKIRNVEPLYGWIPGRSTLFLSATQASQTVYFLEDEEVDLDEIMNEPLPPVPRQSAYTAHWLAVEGVQPAIPENPNPSELESRTLKSIYGNATHSAITEIKSNSLSKTISDKDIADKSQQLTSAILVKTVLTKELQVYYEKVTEALLSNVEELQDLAVESVASDASIPALVPYFIQFIGEELAANMRSLASNTAVIRLSRALLTNPNLFIEPYLHQLIPNILSCVVAKKLCQAPETEPHWELRDFSAKLIAFICKKFNSSYGNLQPRVTKTYLRALLDPLKPITTNYGALSGIYELGSEISKILIVPNISALSSKYLGYIKDANSELSNLKDEDIQIDVANATNGVAMNVDGSIESHTNIDGLDNKKRKMTSLDHKSTANWIVLRKGAEKCLSKLEDILLMVDMPSEITWKN